MLWNPEIETLEREALRRLQLERLQATLRRVYARVPFYRELFDAAGTPPDSVRSLEDLVRLPFTRKSDLREHYPFGLFTTRELGRSADAAGGPGGGGAAEEAGRPAGVEIVRIHASSGTRGKPTVVGYTRHDIAVWAEVCARSICAAGGRPGDILHNAYGYGLFTGGLGLHYGAELMGCTVVPISGGNTPRQIMLLQDLGARILCCTPSYALNIGDALREAGVPPEAIRLEVGIFGAEPWSESMRREIEAVLPLKARDIYGLSEVIGPGVAMETLEEPGHLVIWEDHFLPEIVDPETGDPLPPGEWGELVFTTLAKEAMPVVRYRTGDISRLIYEPDASGRTHVKMGRIKGRSDDMLIVRGVNVFPSEVEAALVGHPDLAPHYQLVVDRGRALDTIEVQVEVVEEIVRALGGFDPEHPRLAEIRGRVTRHLTSALGLHTIVTLQPPRSVPRSEGKAVRVVDKRKI